MTAGNNAVKHTARTILNTRMLKSVFSASAIIFSTFICYYTAALLEIVTGPYVATAIFAVSALFLLAPLYLGLLRFFWRQLFGAEDLPICVFYYLSNKSLYKKVLKYILTLTSKILGISVIIALPAFAVWLASQGFIYEMLDMPIPIWSANLNNVFVFLRSIAIVVITAIALKYYLSPILFVADENIDISEALYMSKTISRKTYIDFVFLCFSFLGWILLSILIIPLIFTLPYMVTAYTVHSRFAIADYNLFVEKNSQKNFYGFSENFDNEF